MSRRLPKLIGLMLLAVLTTPGVSSASALSPAPARKTTVVSKAHHRRLHPRQSDAVILPPHMGKAAWHRSSLAAPWQASDFPSPAVPGRLSAKADFYSRLLRPYALSVIPPPPCPKIGGLRGPPAFPLSEQSISSISTESVRRIKDETGEHRVLHPLSL